MVSREQEPIRQLQEAVDASTEDEKFALGCVAEMVEQAVEIRRQAGTTGMPASFSGNIDSVPYSVFIGPEQEEETK